MKLCQFVTASVLALSGVASQAHAAPMTYSQLSNFAFTVSDLTPDDGVGPAFGFTSPIYDNVGYDFQGAWLGPVDASGSYSGAVQQQVTFSQGGTNAYAHADGYNLVSEANVDKGAIKSRASFLQYFSLGPNTKVTFSIDWRAFSDSVYPLGNYSSGYLVTRFDDLDTFFSAFRMTDYFHGYYDGGLTVAIESGAAGVTGFVAGMASSSAYNPASDQQAVSEPGTLGVMLGGLMVLAALRRQRTR